MIDPFDYSILMQKKYQKNKWQLICAIVLIGFGFYSIVSSMQFHEISRFAEGVSLGQGSIFIIWGLRELIGNKLNNEVKQNA